MPAPEYFAYEAFVARGASEYQIPTLLAHILSVLVSAFSGRHCPPSHFAPWLRYESEMLPASGLPADILRRRAARVAEAYAAEQGDR